MKKHILLPLGLVTLLACVASASQEQLAASIKEARVEATRTEAGLKATLDSVVALTRQREGDLRPAFNTFTAEIPKAQAAADWTRTRVRWMAGDGQQYFTDWQRTLDGVSGESLRKKGQKRLDTARKSYANVEAALKAAGEKFAPFLGNLADIQKVLSADLTAAGIRNIRGTVRDAEWNYKAVQSSIKRAIAEMEKMEKQLAPEAR